MVQSDRSYWRQIKILYYPNPAHSKRLHGKSRGSVRWAYPLSSEGHSLLFPVGRFLLSGWQIISGLYRLLLSPGSPLLFPAHEFLLQYAGTLIVCFAVGRAGLLIEPLLKPNAF